MTLLFRENRRHNTERQTDEQAARLAREGRVISILYHSLDSVVVLDESPIVLEDPQGPIFKSSSLVLKSLSLS